MSTPCPSCREETPYGAPFCPACGASLLRWHEPLEPLRDGTRPVMRVRPVFLTSAHLRANAPVYLFVAAWTTLVAGGCLHLLLDVAGAPVPTWAPFAAVGALMAVLVPLVGMTLSRRTYAGTEFVFHPHRIDYKRGFLTLRSRSMRLADVTDVRLAPADEATAPELGTILISAGPSRADADASLRITDVADASELVERIRALLDEPAPAIAPVTRAA